MRPRRCAICREDAVPGNAWCRRHGGQAWSRRGSTPRNYSDALYIKNRALAIAREPVCHWRFPGCTVKSTQADHLRRGGGHELENLVASCRSCNQKRGGAEGRATMKKRAAAQARRKQPP